MDYDFYVDGWNRRVGETTAHLKTDGKFLVKEDLEQFYDKAIDGINFNKKSVLDIGCGGGLLGEYLLYKNDCTYTGIDIAERSVQAAKERLKDLNAMIIIIPDPLCISGILNNEFDIAICLNVIQHIPDREYFDLFLQALNESGINQLILQFKFKPVTTFQANPYQTTHEINLACYTNQKAVKKALGNYKITSSKKSGENIFMQLEKN